MKNLVVSGVRTDVYFSSETKHTDILIWLHRKLVEICKDSSTKDGNNMFMLNEPISCGISEYVWPNEKYDVQFLIRGDEDYKIIDIENIKPVF